MPLFSDDQQHNQQNYQPKYESKEAKEALKLVDDKSPFGLLYNKICELLLAKKVPTTRFPSKEHFMSRFVDCIDMEKLNIWLDKYIELEALITETEDYCREEEGGDDTP